VFNKLRYLVFKSKQKQSSKYVGETYTIKENIEINETNLKNFLGKSEDIVFIEFEILTVTQTKVVICFVKGLVNTEIINEFIVKPLMNYLPSDNYNNDGIYTNLIKTVKDHTLSVGDLKEARSMDQVIPAVLSGETALFIDGNQSAILISTQGFESRSVEEPKTESSVRGPREGFVENLQVNTSLIRRKIKNPNLIFEKLTLGKQTSTTIYIGFIEGIANQKIIQEVKSRLNRIDTDSILDSGYIEQFIEDHPFSLFNTILLAPK
jgi:spore germination protein KA